VRYYSTVGRRRRRGRFTRILVLSLIAAVLIWAGAGWRVGSLITQGEDAVIQGDLAAATKRLEAASFYRLRAGRVLEAEGFVALAQGHNDVAAGLLERARAAGTRRTGLDLARIGGFLAHAARYAEIDLLTGHRAATGGARIPPLWRAETALAMGRLDEAGKLLDEAIAGDRGQRLRDLLAERRREGRADILFDRGGRSIYSLTLEDGEPIVGSPELGAALTGEGGLLQHLDERDLRARVDLTLDLAFQRAAHTALGRYTGSFVALDPRSGAILALVNHPAGATGEEPAYRRQFEPGSILKMVTLAAALENEIPLDGIFPVNCTGNMTLDGKVFYDWIRHGTVTDSKEATTVSCNLTFAAIGLAMGQARLDDTLQAFGFDRHLDLPDLELPTGHLAQINPQYPRLGLAQRSVGLENVSITPVHAALLAAALAHGGTMMQPHLIAARRSLGSTEPYAVTEPRTLLQPVSAATTAVIAGAMEAVITSPQGTGRRAALDGLSFALKTGTAGKRDSGLNSIIIGYAPLDDPQVAFAFVAEHAGKAELEGARIVRDFLSTVRNEFKAGS
jgi:peptidoglycan glycosyltransferase